MFTNTGLSDEEVGQIIKIADEIKIAMFDAAGTVLDDAGWTEKEGMAPFLANMLGIQSALQECYVAGSQFDPSGKANRIARACNAIITGECDTQEQATAKYLQPEDVIDEER